jgi:dihydrofolate reductase
MIAIYAHCGNILGRGAGMPWHIPDELRMFREATWGHTVVMGRATWDTLPKGLPQRRCMVLTRTPFAGVQCITSPDEAPEQAFVIGGPLTLTALWHRVTMAIVTEVHLDMPQQAGDAIFEPDWSRMRLLSADLHTCRRSGAKFTVRAYEVRP